MKRLKALLQSEAGSALPLLAASVLALVIANSPFDWLLSEVLQTKLTVDLGGIGLSKPLVLWINDGLMAVFFLLVGLEIKREVLEGELSRPALVALPIAAALGGIAVPAAIYAAFTFNDSQALHGWAIPSATDIAFAVAVLAALGPRVPRSLKLFLLTLAIVDDLAAIVIIAVFYTAELSTLSLALAALCILILVGFNLSGIRRLGPYLLVGIVLWICVLESGVHATLAGVVLAFCLPLSYRTDAPEERPYIRLEHALAPRVSYFVLPAFAFANSGLNLFEMSADMARAPITLGIVAGLFLGKQIGIFAGAATLIVLGLARLPSDVRWSQLYGASVCGGIGFTMSLFIGTLAFESDGHQSMVRLGVLVGSLLSAAVGFTVLRLSPGRSPG
ncbi:sodium/proton antiporter, NhaA family (TC 2.A.33.1.1) [Enhydrobacter aerosaccus]|uniref:Na(+)/H(+) antiporter NhaA n=1 Tax=Enhydrobacter aerosaccus TaxID=225324 RepID=A0A1T4SZL8_9HYPH|nr:Na+/H+ antiporter NhaA [Enhydrobacter aerosaccus]SKA33572.1 sodium/proton antiporter, NhaA family (TC 2.A.33.1.1) [Enhydrobacter aerosaccus]